MVEQKEKAGSCTLSFWRLSDKKIWNALTDFSAAPDWSYDDANEEACREEVQALFTRMNKAMVEQERNLFWPDGRDPLPNEQQWSVVFGGKYAGQPCSIAEQLVDLLLSSTSVQARVYTVSRTSTPKGAVKPPPENVVHFSKLNLEEANGGQGEFEEVIKRVVDDWEEENKGDFSITDGKTPIVLYFTLAKHKGGLLPFQRNIQGAYNFVQALENIVPTRFNTNGIPWRVVVTGTDATNPSTQPDPTLTVQDVPTTVPVYKILPHNTVYAASKLCQFYSIATAVASMTNTTVSPPFASSRPGHDGSLASITKQLRDFVFQAGEDGTYRENSILTDKELDEISKYWTNVAEPALQTYLQTAKNIPICYTPLHRDPWTQMCLSDRSKGSPKKFMIQNIIWRLKNAISIDRAARAHF